MANDTGRFITLNIQKFLFLQENNALLLQKNNPRAVILSALQAQEFFILFGKENDVLKFSNIDLQHGC